MDRIAPSALVDFLSNPAALLDEEHRVVHLNPAWVQLAGPDHPPDKPFPLSQLIFTADHPPLLSALQSADAAGNRRALEVRLSGAQGSERWHRLDVASVPGATDGFRVCVATDIHELKSRAATLERQVAIQTEMLNVGVDCIKMVALDGTVIHMNRAGCRALGVPEDSPFGMPWLPLLPEDVWEAGESALATARRGKFARFSGRSSVGQSVQHWDNQLTPVIGPDGKPTAILCVSREVTAEREALASLRESGERLAIAARVGGLGIWDYDIRQDQLHCDDAWYAIMGRDPASPIRSVAEFRPLIHPEDVDRATDVQRTAEELIVGERDYAIQFRIIRPDGTIRWVRSAACLMQDHAGAPIRAVGFVVDITDAKLAEQRFQQSHEVLTQAERLARMGNWRWDIAADHAVWSEPLYEIFGLDPSRPAPRLQELREIFTEDSFETFLRVAGECVNAGQSYSVDLDGRRTDGSRCFVNARGEPVRDNAGGIVQVRGTLTDITERKDVENRMRELSERIQLAVEAGGVGIWEMDAATQRFLWDEQMHALYGLRLGEFGGTLEDWRRLIHPADAGRVMADWANALSYNPNFNGEFRIVLPDGTVRYLRAQARTFRQSGGRVTRAIGTNWDITAAREAEERLRAERHLLRTLVDHLPEVVFITDREDQIQLVNPALRAALSLPPEPELIGRKLHGFMPPEVGERLWRESREVMETGIPLLNRVEHIQLPDGGEEWVRTSKIPRLDGHGRVIGVITFSTNITPEYAAQKKIQEQATQLASANAELHSALSEAERHAQRAQASERAKAEFLAVMSHEIRTPMNSVLGMVRLALQTQLTPKQHNYLSKIDLSAKALVAIINDILDFSKIEAGGMTLEFVEFSIDSLLESVSAVTAMRAEEKGLEIVFDVSGNVPERIIGDSLRVGQILINLVNNAVKFTSEGEVVVSIGTEPTPAPDIAMLRFSVRDTGIGLNDEQISRLFRPFTQADVAVSRKFGGTGLGLTICKSLVEMMGGTIHVESEAGVGSTFQFTIRAELPQSLPALPGETRHDLDGRRLLIVDDNASARDILGRMVRRFGVNAHATSSAHEGLEALRRASDDGTPFEVVLMDWRMPGMDGLECARLVKADTRLRRIPAVLMVTAYAREEILRQAEQLRLDGVLIKPVTESVMFNTLMDALGRSHVSRRSLHAGHAPDPSLLRGLRVLMADDNELNREVLTEFLQQLGLVVEAVNDGSAVLPRLQDQGDFDYVLLDMEMAVMSGVETARLVRLHPRFAKIPIIAMTGHADAEARRATHEAGMNGHIAKPIHPEVLRDELLRLRPAVPGQALLMGRRVLVVDDNALNREVAGDFLIAVGMEAEFATSGREALERLEEAQFDVVLMDVQMPEMDGIEATRIIRRHPHLATLPVIALTAQAQASDREASLAAGMDAHLTKPIDETALYGTIRHCLGAAPQATVAAEGALTPLASPPPANGLLPGIDLEVARKLLGAGPENLSRFLRGFVRDFSDAPETLDRHLAQNEVKALGLLGHTIKSTAAYLGAQALSDAAALVERAEREGRPADLPPLVADFKRHLRTVLSGIEKHLEGEASPQPGNSGGDASELAALLARARPLIQRGSFEANALLQEIQSRLTGTPHEAAAASLCDQFEDTELAAATASLDRLQRLISLPPNAS